METAFAIASLCIVAKISSAGGLERGIIRIAKSATTATTINPIKILYILPPQTPRPYNKFCQHFSILKIPFRKESAKKCCIKKTADTRPDKATSKILREPSLQPAKIITKPLQNASKTKNKPPHPKKRRKIAQFAKFHQKTEERQKS